MGTRPGETAASKHSSAIINVLALKNNIARRDKGHRTVKTQTRKTACRKCYARPRDGALHK